MKQAIRIAMASAIVAIGAGAAASGASAYSISGGAFTASASSTHTASIGGAYQADCPSVTYSGTATGSATMSLTPSFSGCTHFGFPLTYTVSGSWDLTITDGPIGGVYAARLDIPASASITAAHPIAGCTVVNSGPQSFPMVTLTNTVWGLQVDASVAGIAYAATGCPFGDGTDAQYETNGPVLFPGVTVS